jgi:hypothetical protein
MFFDGQTLRLSFGVTRYTELPPGHPKHSAFCETVYMLEERRAIYGSDPWTKRRSQSCGFGDLPTQLSWAGIHSAPA